ncbi:MAG: alpha/beta fold hydrolase [Deltaproteobacteria bacterium]|nr:alpha/beta fold hydrolase [Deltaproteobacteria bacterium]
MATFKGVASTVGHAALGAGLFIGGKIAQGYRSIDPDVMRHLAHVSLLSYSLLASRREEIDPGEPDGYPPLILVHGMGGNPGTFIPMAWYLRLQGRKRNYKISFQAGQSIEEMAEALTEFVAAVIAATGERQVEIVAHSLGGVVSRLAMADHGLASRVKTLITMGSPHHGTYCARFANTELTRELRPDSPLMLRLARTPWPKRVRGVSFWSRADLFVLPPESAALEGTDQVDASPVTHYGYLIGPRIWVAVAQALASRSPTSRPPAVTARGVRSVRRRADGSAARS